jgi:hypothetical protein
VGLFVEAPMIFNVAISLTAEFAQSTVADGIEHVATATVASAFAVDITATREVLAELAVTANTATTVEATNLIDTTLTIDSAMSFESVITGLLAAESIWTSTVSQSTVSELVLDATSTFAVETTQQTISDNIKPFEVVVSPEFTTALTAQNTIGAGIAVSAAASTSIDVLVTRVQEAQAVFVVEHTQTCRGNQIFTFASEFEVYDWTEPPTWDDWPNERWGFTGQRVFAGQFAQQVDAGIEFIINIPMSSQTAMSVDSVNTKNAQATLDAVATVTSAPEVTHVTQAMSFDSLVSWNLISTGTQEGEAVFEVQAQITTQPDLTLGAAIPMPDAFAFSAVFGASLVGELVLPVTAQFTAIALNIHDAVPETFVATTTMSTLANPVQDQLEPVVFNSTFSTVSTAAVLHTTPAVLPVQATQSAFAAVLNNVTDIEWFAFNSILAIGQEMQSDPYRQIEVPCENRTLCVLKETRRLEVPCENRINRVAQPPWNEALYRRVA